jgi:hypothetical protein
VKSLSSKFSFLCFARGLEKNIQAVQRSAGLRKKAKGGTIVIDKFLGPGGNVVPGAAA